MVDDVLDYVFAPATWWADTDLNPVTRVFSLLPVCLVQVLVWLVFSTFLCAVFIGPWVAVGLLVWWLV